MLGCVEHCSSFWWSCLLVCPFFLCLFTCPNVFCDASRVSVILKYVHRKRQVSLSWTRQRNEILLTWRESIYIDSVTASHMVSSDFFELHLQGIYSAQSTTLNCTYHINITPVICREIETWWVQQFNFSSLVFDIWWLYWRGGYTKDNYNSFLRKWHSFKPSSWFWSTFCRTNQRRALFFHECWHKR